MIQLLEKNYRVFCATSEPPVEIPEDFDARAFVLQVLAESGFAEQRARMMSVDDFLV